MLVLVPLGFYCKFYAGPASDWVNNSLSGVFYVAFWCVLVYLVTNIPPATIAVTVLVITSLLEFMQTWQTPFLQTVRGSFLGRTLLGTTFTWWDFPYYAAGSGVGYLWLRRIGGGSDEGRGHPR